MLKVTCALALIAIASGAAEDITPHVGVVQVFGLQKLSLHKIESALDVKPGDRLPHADEAEQRLDKVSGVVSSTVEAVCCYGKGMVLYVGVEEKNAPHMPFHPAPTGANKLPDALWDKYSAVVEAAEASLHGRNADEDLTAGYSLMADPEGRQLQTGLLPLVAAYLAEVNDTVRNSADPEQRAGAAYLLQYAPRTAREIKVMTDALQYAVQDPDGSVRANAMIALKAVLVGARLHPAQHIHIEPTWFVELMNSSIWSDRRNASLTLVTLTDKNNPDALDLIRERALASVCDMAGWQDLEHALPGFILAGRLAGLDQKQIESAWLSGDRASVIREARQTARAKR